MSEFKPMTLSEFLDLGLLQEVNRQFFHPLGLAMAAVCALPDDANKTEWTTQILSDDDPAGTVFCKIDVEKADRFREWMRGRAPDRVLEWRFVTQPDDQTFEAENGNQEKNEKHEEKKQLRRDDP